MEKEEATKLARKLNDELILITPAEAELFDPDGFFGVSVRNKEFTQKMVRRINEIIKDFEVEFWIIFTKEEGLVDMKIR